MDDFLLAINQTIRALLTLPCIPDYHFASMTARKRIDPRRLSYDRRTRALGLNELGISISRGRNEFMLDVLRYAVDLTRVAGARFSESEDGTLVVDVKGITAEVRTAGEVEVLWEVFAQDIYNLDICKGKVVWDIGMNVGLATLFFAVCKEAKVYGFEPFPQTYSRAVANLSLNPIAVGSVFTFRKGVAGSGGTMEVAYDPVNHGSNGLFGPTREPTSQLETADIDLVGAVETFDMISSENPGLPIVLKIDCEGAEYDILTALRNAGRLERIEAILMEWHVAGDHHGPRHLEEDLHSAGFSFITLNKADWATGMIYAFRSSKPLQTVAEECCQSVMSKRSDDQCYPKGEAVVS